MDGYRWLSRGNDIRRVFARTQYVEVSEDFNRVCSVSNDVRLRLTFHYSYDLLVRVGHTMERRMAHESRWDSSSLFNGTFRDSASLDGCAIVTNGRVRKSSWRGVLVFHEVRGFRRLERESLPFPDPF